MTTGLRFAGGPDRSSLSLGAHHRARRPIRIARETTNAIQGA